MMIKNQLPKAAIAALTLSFCSTAYSFDFSSSIETRAAYSNKDNQFEKSEIILRPELQWDIGERSSFTLKSRLRADGEDLLEPGEPEDANRSSASNRVFISDDVETEIRAAYLDIEIGSSYLRLGKQQIVWGQADGLKVLDVLNPQSFREFILADFEDSRIPLWAANADIPLDDNYNLQLIWIPGTTYDDIPEQGARYAFTSPALAPTIPENTPVTFAPVDKPNDAINDADIGVRLSTFKNGWDLTLNYAYHYFDRPTVRRTISAQGIGINQTYERSQLLGGTFSNAFGDFTLRGELGYSMDRYFLLNDTQDADGVFKTDDFSYVLGIDYSGLSNWFLSGQIFQSTLLDYIDTGLRDKTDSTLTLLARRNLNNETLTLEALYLHSLNNQDGLLRLSADYQFNNTIELSAGIDIFHGEATGFYGQFDQSDRITIGLTASF